MGNWLDDLEKKKRDEQAASDEERRKWLRDYEAKQKADERMYQSVKELAEPIFTKLEVLVKRANDNGFFLIASRAKYNHGFEIFRYDASEMRVGFDRRGDFQMGSVLTRSRGNEEYLKGVAEVSLYPKADGLEISFTEADISMGWKKGKWYTEKKVMESKFYEHVGTVPYGSISDNDLASIVKWIATGKELPRFGNVIPGKEWKPSYSESSGCLSSPWAYIIPLAVVLLLYFFFYS
jgi:hypothetical protein